MWNADWVQFCSHLSVKNDLVVVNKKLYGVVLGVHVTDFTLVGGVTQECWREDNSQIPCGHKILFFPCRNSVLWNEQTVMGTKCGGVK